MLVVGPGCRRLERLRFQYPSGDGSGQRSERSVEPFRLVPVRRRWYLVAPGPRPRRLAHLPGRPRRRPRGDHLAVRAARAPGPRGVRAALRSPPRPYRYVARVRVHAPLADVAEQVSPSTGRLEADGPGACVLTAGGDGPAVVRRLPARPGPRARGARAGRAARRRPRHRRPAAAGRRAPPVRDGGRLRGPARTLAAWALLIFLVVLALAAGVVVVGACKRNQRRDAGAQGGRARPRCASSPSRTSPRWAMELQDLDLDLAGAQLDPGANADYQRALDAYESAKKAADTITEPEHVKHVTEILEDGRYAMACVRARVAGRAAAHPPPAVLLRPPPRPLGRGRRLRPARRRRSATCPPARWTPSASRPAPSPTSAR